MQEESPIACSLSRDELAGRLAEMRTLGQDALVSSDDSGTLRFRGDPRTRARLESIIAAESRCCPFLAFELSDEAGDLVLRIEAPSGASGAARDLVHVFTDAA